MLNWIVWNRTIFIQMDLGLKGWYCCILVFDPAKNAITRWCTGRKWHILMAVMRVNRMGRNWLMKWNEVKNSHGSLIDRKRGTCELHDSYFRLMTIKHAISKIEWAIQWTLNYYITQSRQKSREFELSSSSSSSWSWVVVRKATPGRRGLGPWWIGGPEKMPIRCSKESHHPAEWVPGPPVEHQENKKDTTLTAIRVRVKIFQFCWVSSSLSHANLE